MFEVGDAVLLPPEFGSGKKGVLARKEPKGMWLVQTGTTGYAFLPEKDLRPLTMMKKCWACGTQWDPHAPASAEGAEQCPACGARDCRKPQVKK